MARIGPKLISLFKFNSRTNPPPTPTGSAAKHDVATTIKQKYIYDLKLV